MAASDKQYSSQRALLVGFARQRGHYDSSKKLDQSFAKVEAHAKGSSYLTAAERLWLSEYLFYQKYVDCKRYAFPGKRPSDILGQAKVDCKLPPCQGCIAAYKNGFHDDCPLIQFVACPVEGHPDYKVRYGRENFKGPACPSCAKDIEELQRRILGRSKLEYSLEFERLWKKNVRIRLARQQVIAENLQHNLEHARKLKKSDQNRTSLVHKKIEPMVKELERKRTESELRKEFEWKELETKDLARRDLERKQLERQESKSREIERLRLKRAEFRRQEAHRNRYQSQVMKLKDLELREHACKEIEQREFERRESERKEAERKAAKRQVVERRVFEGQNREGEEHERHEEELRQLERDGFDVIDEDIEENWVLL